MNDFLRAPAQSSARAAMGFDVGEFRIFVRTNERSHQAPDVELLRQHFLQFGEVLDVHKPARTPDVAYITMATAVDLQAALSDAWPEIAGVGVNLQQAMPRGTGPPGSASFAAAVPGAVAPPPQAAPQVAVNTHADASGARIYVAPLAEDLDTETLNGYFSYFGTVKDVYIPVDRITNQKKPFAFVTMSSPDEMNAVLSMPNHQLTDIHTVNVTLAAPRDGGKGGGGGISLAATGGTPAAGPPSAGVAPSAYGTPSPAYATIPRSPQVQQAPQVAVEEAGTRLYVTQLTPAVDEEILRVYFTYFGQVRDVYIPADYTTGLKKPFAFVTMFSAEDTQNVLQFPSHQITDQVSVNVTMAEVRQPGQYSGAPALAPEGGVPVPQTVLPPTAAAPSAKGVGKNQQVLKQGIPGNYRLFVWGLPAGLNADMLRGHFARHGDILDIYVPPRKPDNAYITFSLPEELQDALENSGVRIAGFTVLGLKEAQPKDQAKGKGKYRSEPY